MTRRETRWAADDRGQDHRGHRALLWPAAGAVVLIKVIPHIRAWSPTCARRADPVLHGQGRGSELSVEEPTGNSAAGHRPPDPHGHAARPVGPSPPWAPAGPGAPPGSPAGAVGRAGRHSPCRATILWVDNDPDNTPSRGQAARPRLRGGAAGPLDGRGHGRGCPCAAASAPSSPTWAAPRTASTVPRRPGPAPPAQGAAGPPVLVYTASAGPSRPPGRPRRRRRHRHRHVADRIVRRPPRPLASTPDGPGPAPSRRHRQRRRVARSVPG